ncbi:MAG: hypothetical protein ACRDPI_10175 [Nocardioidaceae bacterium]
MTVVWTVLVPLAEKTPPPSKVKPGWIAFWIIIALLVAVLLLGRSLNTHLKRVNFVEEPGESGESGEPEGPGESDRNDADDPKPDDGSGTTHPDPQQAP